MKISQEELMRKVRERFKDSKVQIQILNDPHGDGPSVVVVDIQTEIGRRLCYQKEEIHDPDEFTWGYSGNELCWENRIRMPTTCTHPEEFRDYDLVPDLGQISCNGEEQTKEGKERCWWQHTLEGWTLDEDWETFQNFGVFAFFADVDAAIEELYRCVQENLSWDWEGAGKVIAEILKKERGDDETRH